MTTRPANPWYREPWLWILMAGPAAVIVAGGFTAWLAISTDDGLVADDYYRQGLAINRTLAREAAARSLGYRARVSVSAERIEVRFIAAQTARTPQGTLRLRLVHPTRAGGDRNLTLSPTSGGVFEARAAGLVAGRWQLVLEDTALTWRLVGSISIPVPALAVLGGNG